LALLCRGGRVALGDEAADNEAPATAQDELRQRGEATYQRSCASCHGAQGEGVAEFYPDPLTGDSTVDELTDLITETMPEDDPAACVGEEAAAVAAFIHRAFYGESAQVASRSPRAGLAHLTAPQLRQSLADLYASDNGVIWTVKDHGLQGLYFDGASPRDDNKVIERRDPVIDFDFAGDGPGEGIDPKDFCIRWRGALKADVTGSYELVLRSTCAFVCYFGSDDRTFIDNLVQSGDKSEFRRWIVLTGGRAYPLRIEFLQRPRKTEQPPARISLSWRPPHGVEQIIPPRNLLSAAAPATFSLQAMLPPDDRTYGYERGITVDRHWDESTTAAALEFADVATDELWPRYQKRHGGDSDENRGRLRNFLAELVRRAFRGQLDDNVRSLYVEQHVDASEDDAEAIRRSLLMSLKSPRFLYPTLGEPENASRRAANRLALILFDSLPSDEWLLRRASGKELESDEQVRAAARRMVFDYRAQSKTRELMYAWLNVDHTDEITKDENAFAGFDALLLSDLRASLDAQLDDVVWSGSGDYRQLFQADWTYTTQRLAEFYGQRWAPADAGGHGLRRSVPDPEHRFGVLSHPYLMSRLAHHDATSPIHRGVFLIRYLLGRTLRPPDEAFVPLAPDLHPDLSTREQVEMQTSPESCQVCHGKINGLGFTLENYDAVGRYRETERQRPIDPTGHYTTTADTQVEFAGPRELAEFLSTSSDTQRAFVKRAFQHFVKQPPAAFGAETLDRLSASFLENDYNIRELLVEIAVVAATHNKPTDEQDDPNAASDDET
jgi:mono/diheme cytochrome c family protein